MRCGPSTDRRDLILIRVLHQHLFPRDWTCDLGERCTAGDRYEPLSSAGMWTKRGPSPSCSLSSAFGAAASSALSILPSVAGRGVVWARHSEPGDLVERSPAPILASAASHNPSWLPEGSAEP